MSLQRRASQDESKTYDQSIVIHDDIEVVGTSVAMNELLTTQSVPAKTVIRDSKLRPDSARISNKTSNINNKNHGRNVSVGTMIPSRYLNQAPSLIALLDVQTSRVNKINVPITSFRISKSVPDYTNNMNNNANHGNHTPSLNSEDDFDAPNKSANVFGNSNGHLHDSEDNIVGVDLKLNSNTSMDSMVIKDDKQIEYEKLIAGVADNTDDNDEIVDMQLLAAKAAQEFTVLANENQTLVLHNMGLKEKYDDLQHEKDKLYNQMVELKNKYQNNTDLINDIDILKSKAEKWKMEKKVLMEQLQSRKTRGGSGSGSVDIYGQRKNSNSMLGKTALKLKNDTSEDAHTLMMESLAQVTKEKNELETRMEMDKHAKRGYEMTISNLKKELRDKECERDRLSNDLDKQQELYYSLKKNAKKKELEIDNIVGRNRTKTLEQQQEEQKQKQQLLEAVDEQKAYIQHLEQENQKLMNTKIKDDDQMFFELKQFRAHRFQQSMQFDAISNLASSDGGGAHSRDPSMSNYSQSGMFYTHPSNADLGLKSVRTQINLFNIEDFENEEDIMIEKEPEPDNKTEEDAATPQPNDQQKKKVNFIVPNKTVKEQKKQRKKEEINKINAEIEFFLLTCFSVKANLAEEYPTKQEVLTEDAMKLFESAQKDRVVMSKFNLWIEYQLREKYDLPKMKGFAKFMEKHHVKDKLATGYKKTKKGTKKLAQKTEKASIKAGHYIAEKAEEIGARIRAYSKAPDDENKDFNNDTPIVEGNEWENYSENKVDEYDIKNNTETQIEIVDENDRTVNKDSDVNKDVNDNVAPNNIDNKQCCVIL